MEHNLPDTIRHVLEVLHLGLPACVHHPDDHKDGGGESVELLLQPYDRQTDVSAD